MNRVRRAWQSARIEPLVCRETASVLLRVLAYPKFRLAAAEQRTLLSEFLPFATAIELPRRWPPIPSCRDRHDEVFLALALVGGAEALVTGDSDLLELAQDFVIPIETAAQFIQRLHS